MIQGWHQRMSTTVDYHKFFVYYDAYLTLKAISQTYPDLKMGPFFALDKWNEISKKEARIQSIWNQLLRADTSAELLQNTQAFLHKTITEWGKVSAKKNIFTNQPDIAQQIKNSACLEAKKRWAKSIPYYSLEDCFLAYQLSSYASIYGDLVIPYRKSETEMIIQTPHDLPVIEMLWMQGYLSGLQSESNKFEVEMIQRWGKPLYRWSAINSATKPI